MAAIMPPDVPWEMENKKLSDWATGRLELCIRFVDSHGRRASRYAQSVGAINKHTDQPAA